MNAKKAVDFLILRSAFTRRNFSSLFLVGVFFGVYVMSGGKIATKLPKLKEAGAFGDVAIPEPEAGPSTPAQAAKEKAEQAKAMELLGATTSAEREARENAVNSRGLLFDSKVDEPVEPIDPDGLIKADTENRRLESKLRKQEARNKDSLAAIEERLNIKRTK